MWLGSKPLGQFFILMSGGAHLKDPLHCLNCFIYFPSKFQIILYTYRESNQEILSSDEDDVNTKKGKNLALNKPTMDQEER